MKATECLNAEHTVFLIQMDRLDLALKQPDRYPPIAWQAMVELLRVAVDRHAHIEEAGVYKALEVHIGRNEGPLAVMDQEHEEIRKTVQEIARWKPGMPGIPLRENLAHFSEVLRGHIEKEKKVLFPMAEKLLGDQKLTELACQCSHGQLEELVEEPT